MKFLYKNSALLEEKTITETSSALNEYINHLNDVAQKNNYEDAEASINLPFDDELLKKVTNLKEKKVTKNLKYIFLIGIGGSNLGTKAIYDSIFGYYDSLEKERYPKIIFLDTQDGVVLSKTKNLINSLSSKEEILVNAISKSGGTTETTANFEVIYEVLQNKFGEIDDRVVITTVEGSKMQMAAQAKQIEVLNIPQKVGGRYSVFSAVGLFPLMAAGFDVFKLRQGAQKMRDVCLQKTPEDNPAVISAAIIYLHYKAGKNINDNFIFLPSLESLGKWYRQLQGESVGKDNKGITPTVSIGSTDLHSVGQLYLGGPKDKITTFIYGENLQDQISVPQNTAFNLVDVISGKSIQKIMSAIVGGVTKAYQSQRLPFTEIVFDGVSEESLGEFMQFKMIEIMCLGKLMGVNAFDQPQVELYKTETKKILS